MNIISQEAGRTALERLLQIAQGFIVLPALGGEQTQSFPRQGAGGREFLRLRKIQFSGIGTVNPEQFVAQSEISFHGRDGSCSQGYGRGNVRRQCPFNRRKPALPERSEERRVGK